MATHRIKKRGGQKGHEGHFRPKFVEDQIDEVSVLHRLAAEGEMDMVMLVERRTHLELWIDRLLNESVDGAGEMRIRNRLAKQRSHLIGCLYDLAAEPTNNRAERSLRPAVIARKISCGNKTDRGRQTWQTIASLAATCLQRGEDLIDYLTTQLLFPAEREY